VGALSTFIQTDQAQSRPFQRVPPGVQRHGYEFVAPFDTTSHIDAALWRQHRHACGVRRFWESEPDEHGFLVYRPGGPSTDVGYSITMRLRKTMMKAATGSVRTHSARVNMSPFAARKRDAHLPGYDRRTRFVTVDLILRAHGSIDRQSSCRESAANRPSRRHFPREKLSAH
jgi:hypothetical protein